MTNGDRTEVFPRYRNGLLKSQHSTTAFDPAEPAIQGAHVGREAPSDRTVAPHALTYRSGRSWLSAALSVVATLAVTAAGCGSPDRPGPNVEDVPHGFFYDANASAARKVFMDVEPLDQSGWFAHNQNDDHSSIMITTYAGQVPEDAIRAARNAHAERWGRRNGSTSGSDYGPVEEVEIDGHQALAWEVRQYYKGDLCSIEWVAVVPYEESTYAVEFFAGMEEYMDPELIRRTVQSFEAD